MAGFLFLYNYLFNPGVLGSVLMIILAAGFYFIFLFAISKFYSAKWEKT